MLVGLSFSSTNVLHLAPGYQLAKHNMHQNHEINSVLAGEITNDRWVGRARTVFRDSREHCSLPVIGIGCDLGSVVRLVWDFVPLDASCWVSGVVFLWFYSVSVFSLSCNVYGL